MACSGAGWRGSTERRYTVTRGGELKRVKEYAGLPVVKSAVELLERNRI
jgi:hypothetical protein